MLATAASHAIATHSALDPKVAERALFELLALDKIEEHIVILVYVARHLVLSASHTHMKNYSTVEAVVLLALRALQLRAILIALLEAEGEVAVSRGAPAYVFLTINE